MSRERNVRRFGEWAETYERSHLQKLIFDPVQEKALRELLDRPERLRSGLDIGYGTGRFLRRLSQALPQARLFWVDASREMVEAALRRIEAALRPGGRLVPIRVDHMSIIAIACYRPLPGNGRKLLSAVRKNTPLLLALGLITNRPPILMQSTDGTFLEVFEWQ